MRAASTRGSRIRFGLSIVLLLLAQSALAGLGLGEARVESYLGQPLDVRITLLQSGSSALDSLTVEAASAEDHARLGVPSEALALGLRVEVDQSVDPPIIRVRSNRPATEPFVQILINARWASGRILREYTLFLDPPAVPVAPPVRRSEEPAAAAAEPTPEAQERPVPRPDPAAEPAPAPAPAPAPPRDPAPETIELDLVEPAEARVVGPVQAGQTLWSISSAWRSDDSLSMNQVMLAIFEKNPQAFMDSNVNLLRRGAELVMPDQAEVRAIAPAEATQRIREQMETWQAARRAVPVAAPVDPVQADTPAPEVPNVAATEAAPAPPSIEGDGAGATNGAAAEGSELEAAQNLPRLELTSPDEESLSEIETIGIERDHLEERLVELEEEIRAERFDSEEIASSVDQIRQAIESADAGGLMVANEDLALLQQRLADARREREAEAEAAAAAPVEVAEPVEVAQPAPAAGAPSTGPGLTRWLWPALAALLLIALLVFVVRTLITRRQQAADEAVTKPSRPDSRREPELTAAVATGSAGQIGVDGQLVRLRQLAEAGDSGAFARDFEALEADIDDPSDPRWREALTLARALIPGHPLVVAHAPGADAAESADDMDDKTRALMGILDSADDDEAGDLDDDDFGFGGRSKSSSRGSESGEDADLARIADRLDPEERQAGSGDEVVLDEEESAALFPEPTVPATQPEDDEADDTLELDFEFTPVVEDGEESMEETTDQPVADRGPDERPSRKPDESDAAFPSAEPDEAVTADTGNEWFSMDDELVAGQSTDGGDEAADARSELSDDDAEVKMDLARAYLSMDDPDSARALLEEILADGSEAYHERARQLLADLK